MPSDSASNTSLFGRFSARSSFISNKDVKVSVQLLDDSETICNEFKRSQPAQSVLDYVCEVMNIKEKDYFGLRYQDHNKHRYWVDLSRPISYISKQFKSADSIALRLRFRFYPNDPHLLKEEITRYQLFVQLQRDLLHGRLYCPQNMSAQLAALVLQSQLGDYNSVQHGQNYVSEYKLLLKQTPRVEERIAELHKEMSGKKSPAEAELEFLEKACKLDTYGFDPFTVKDIRDSSQAIYIGVTYRGVLIYKGNQKVHNVPWSQLLKVDYLGKEVRVIPNEDYTPPMKVSDSGDLVGSPDKKHRFVIKMSCPSGLFAKHLWTHILSQQAFFTDNTAAQIKPKFSKPRIPLLSRGSTFHFPSRRVLKEIETSFDKEPARKEVSFSRYQLPRQEPRKDAPWLNKYNTLPNLKIHSNNNGSAIDKKIPEKEEIKQNGTSLLDEMARLVTIRTDNSHQSSSLSSSSDQTRAACDSNSNGPQPTSLLTSDAIAMSHNTPEPEELGGTCVDDDVIGEPLHTSTPHNNAIYSASRRDAALAELDDMAEQKIVNKAMTSNGNVTKTTEVSEKITKKPSTLAKMTNLFLSSFLLSLLFVALSIALFERSDDSDWIESNDILSQVRHNVYEPARHVILQTYGKYLGSR